MKTSCATLITDDMIKREMERCRALFDGVEGDVAVGQGDSHRRDPRVLTSIPIHELLSPNSPILCDMAIRNLTEAEGKPRTHYSIDFVDGRLVSVEHYETEFGSGIFKEKSND